MNKKLSSALIAIFTLITLTSSLFAEGEEGKKEKVAKEKTYPTITAVTDSSITLSSGKTFTINSQTKVSVDGVKGEASQLKVGMEASVSPQSSDPSSAGRIFAKTGKEQKQEQAQ